MSFKKNNASNNRGFKKQDGHATSGSEGSKSRFSRPKSNEENFSSKTRDNSEARESRPSSRVNATNSSRPNPNPATKNGSANSNRFARTDTKQERFESKRRDTSEFDNSQLDADSNNSTEKKHYRPSSRPSSGGDTTRTNNYSRANRDNEKLSQPKSEVSELKDGYASEQKPPRASSKPISSNDGVANGDSMRLNRFIANAGICSRREADLLIQKGLITVNGNVTIEMGTIVKKTDKVIYNGTELNSEKKIYILLNKPKDVVTTREDEHAKLTVLDLVRNACTERIYPVGRLDKNTTGVLLLTNDGELTKKLTHPKYERKKIYHVHLDRPVTKAHMDEIASGVKLEDGKIVPDSLEYVDNDKSQIGIEIHSGKNRIVRRIFEHFGYRIEKLDRVYFAGLTKKGLQRSHWRHLTETEVKLLKAGLLT